MQFARVVDAYEKIEATTKRLEMTELLVGLLRETPKEDLDKVVYLTQGRIHPDYEGIELGLAEKMVMRVLAHATGMDDARIGRLWKEKGDLGLVAQESIAARRQKPLESTPLTTAKVYQLLDAIARESGEGSQERKVRLLSDLLGNATPREAKYIVRMVVGQMRLGRAGPRIGKANRSLLPSSREYHGSISRDRGGPAIRNPGPRGDRRRRGRPGRSEHGGVPPVPGSQSPPRAQDGGRADGEGIPRHPVYIRLPPPFG